MSFRASDWKEVNLKEVIEVNPRETIKKGTIAKKIGMNKLGTFQRQIKGFELSSYSGGTKFRNGDTLLARITPCLENGKTAQVRILDNNEIAFGSTEYIVLREKIGETINDFIYYLAISPYLRDIAIKSMTGTSGKERVQKDVIENIKIMIPPISEQKSIAHILSTLDEKIEINNQINKTLENMAQAIFSQWFVDFEFPNEDGDPYKSSGGEMVESELGMIPKGWEIKELQNISEFQNGYAFYKVGYSEVGKKVIDLANVNKLGDFVETKKDKYISLDIYNDPKMEKFKLLKDDLVIIMTDRTQKMNILGKTGKIPYSDKYILNQRVGRIRVGDRCDTNFIRSVLNSNTVLDKLKSVVLGSAQKYINTNHIKKIKLVLPSEKLMSMYSDLVNPIYSFMHNNNEENILLVKKRDLLLPKLMFGEIRVPIEKD